MNLQDIYMLNTIMKKGCRSMNVVNGELAEPTWKSVSEISGWNQPRRDYSVVLILGICFFVSLSIIIVYYRHPTEYNALYSLNSFFSIFFAIFFIIVLWGFFKYQRNFTLTISRDIEQIQDMLDDLFFKKNIKIKTTQPFILKLLFFNRNYHIIKIIDFHIEIHLIQMRSAMSRKNTIISIGPCSTDTETSLLILIWNINDILNQNEDNNY